MSSGPEVAVIEGRHRARRWVDRARSTVEMAVRPHAGLENLYRRFGPVCTLGVGPFRYVYLLGPAANRFILTHSELFSWREAFDALVVVDGETALIVSDGADHQRRRRLVTPAFHRRQIDGYARTMRANADAAIDSWRSGQVVDLYKELRRVIRRSTIEVLFGPRLTADEPELGRLLQRALAVVDRPPPWQQLQRLGLPAWRRAVASRATVAQRVRAEIEYRRSHPDDGARDVLALLVGSRDDDGAGLSDVEIIDQVISLIAAGYETTSAAMSWAVHAVLADAQAWRLARASIAGAESWRYVDTHRLPELWPRPRRFDPERWDPQQPGYRRPGPHEFLPFGGGTHRCLGATFATVEMTVLLERLLGRTTLRLESVDLRPVGLAAMRTRRGPHARVLAVE